MFKAKLIENKKYYQLRVKQAWLSLIPTIAIGPIANFYQFPAWIFISAVLVCALSSLVVFRILKQMKKLSEQNAIEMNEKEIKIKSLSNGKSERIALDELEKIMIQSEYRIPQDSYKDYGNEILGNPKENYLILCNNETERKIDFEIESHYMLTQLNKLITSWSQTGIKIEIVP